MLDMRHHVSPSSIQQPPAEREVLAICLKVITVRSFSVIVVVILQADCMIALRV